ESGASGPAEIDLLKSVVVRTRARVLRGDTRFPGKVVSVFEPHTEIIRKGKLAKPTEFGRLVKIQEAEAQFITDYEVCERGQAERALWVPALDRHIALFDHAPRLAVADGGFASRSNERAAQDRGVRHIVLPRQPREMRSRAARAALRWRTGSEGRISALKRRHGLRRCRYRGPTGMQRWIGLGVLANDLLVLALRVVRLRGTAATPERHYQRRYRPSPVGHRAPPCHARVPVSGRHLRFARFLMETLDLRSIRSSRSTSTTPTRT